MRSQKETEICSEILDELSRDRKKHPDFPDDLVHRVSIVNEESGEAIRAALQAMFEGHPVSLVRKELIETAAMCVRVIHSIDQVRFHDLTIPTELKWIFFSREYHLLVRVIDPDSDVYRVACNRIIKSDSPLVMGVPDSGSICEHCMSAYMRHKDDFRP